MVVNPLPLERCEGAVQLDLDSYEGPASTLMLFDVAYCSTAYGNLVSLSLFLYQMNILFFHQAG